MGRGGGRVGDLLLEGSPKVDALTCSCVSWLGRLGGVSGYPPLQGATPRPHCVRVAPPGNRTDRPTWPRPQPFLLGVHGSGRRPAGWAREQSWVRNPPPGFSPPIPEISLQTKNKCVNEEIKLNLIAMCRENFASI